MSLNYENYIFDLDGTLIDSTPSHVKAFQFAINMSTLSGKVDFDYERMKGKRTIDVMNELGFDNHEAKHLTKLKQEKYRELLNNGEVNLYSDVHNCLKLLSEKNKKVYICTGASRDSVEIILDKFKIRNFIVDYITGSDVKEAKPNPKILNNLIENNQLDKDKCIFIEDSENGYICGQQAHVYTVLVNNSLDGLPSFKDFSHFMINLEAELG